MGVVVNYPWSRFRPYLPPPRAFLPKMCSAMCARRRCAPAEDVRPPQYLPLLKSAHEAYSPQAAFDGMEFVKLLPFQSPHAVSPAAAWRRELRREGDGSELLPERATGMLEEIANVMDKVKADCRRAVFGRRLLPLRFQEVAPPRGAQVA